MKINMKKLASGIIVLGAAFGTTNLVAFGDDKVDQLKTKAEVVAKKEVKKQEIKVDAAANEAKAKTDKVKTSAKKDLKKKADKE